MLGAILGAGASLLGGLIGKSASESSDRSNRAMSREQAQYQKEFAQHGIRWKVEDAKKAGLHPLAALGAQTASYQPQMVPSQPDYSMARGIEGAGQAISRHLPAYRNKMQVAADMLRMKQETARLRNMELQNAIDQKRLEQWDTGGAVSTDSLGIVGQGSAVNQGKTDLGVIHEPSKFPMSQQRGVQAGTAPMELQVIDQKGGLHRTFNQITQEAMENDPYLKYKVFFGKGRRHISRLYPSKREIDVVRKTRPRSPYRDSEYRWNRLSGNWKLFKIGKEGSRLFHPYIRKRKPPYRTPPRAPRKKRKYVPRPHDLHRFDF
ncbi:DNA pilot protein [Microviridae sp.]|nr:DNA pilot protein [Microviridae sp.]